MFLEIADLLTHENSAVIFPERFRGFTHRVPSERPLLKFNTQNVLKYVYEQVVQRRKRTIYKCLK